MSKLLKVVIGIVIAFVLAIGVVYYLTAGMVDTANAFFQAVKRHDLTAAHGYLSEDFKASTDEIALTAFLSNSALLKFKEASWSNRQISGGRGNLEGSVTTESGGVIPLTMMLVKENGQWKIYGIQKPTAGLQTESKSPSMPSNAEQATLVKRSMHDFAISVNEKSMAHFRSTVSQLWQKQITTEKLDEVFAKTYGLNFLALDNLEPTIEPATVLGENGELILKGHFQTSPKLLNFEQKYVYEGTGWKLFGFNVRTE